MESSEQDDNVYPLAPATDTASPDAPDSKKDRAALGWFASGAVAGAILAVGVMLVITAARTPSANVTAGAAQAQPGRNSVNGSEMTLADAQPFVPKVVARPANTQGAAGAPVMIVEYSDFNCGYCKKFHDETFQRVVDAYVKTGKARLSYKHYPFLTASSPWKAEASECAAEQGRFWDYHEMLFNSAIPRDGDEAAVRQQLADAAGAMQLDATAFKACLENSDIAQRVSADANEGQQLGVSGTPSFLINGKPLVGAQPYEAFVEVIEAAIATQSAKP
jgi:protein-disulfide isomerase